MTRVLHDSELEDFPALEWPEIAGRMSSEARNALDQVLASQDGSVLSREQCLLLANAEGDDLLGLLVAADMLRRDLVGNLVTYVVNRNINFTNVCFVGCKFCAFSRGPRESDSYFHCKLFKHSANRLQGRQGDPLDANYSKWMVLNYGRRQVPDFMMAHITESVEEYGFDGLELDWLRTKPIGGW